MDWNGMLETVRNAANLYWMAASAIAAGVSLLAAAFVLHLRQRPARRRPSRPVPAPRATVVPTSAGYTVAAVAEAPSPAVPDLGAVTARLAAAADRLAAIQAELRAEPALPSGSSLKESPSHVEYVFRTGKA